ncbi:MAG: hypothetical protein ACJAQ1_001716, partial [Flavobacterium sp.]
MIFVKTKLIKANESYYFGGGIKISLSIKGNLSARKTSKVKLNL